MNIRVNFFLALTVIYFSNIVLANSSPYFEGNIIDPTLLDEPFKPESKEKQEEIAEIVKLQHNLSAEEIAKATAEYSLVPEKIILPVLPEITRKEYPAVYRLLDRTQETAQNTKDTIKDYWNVRRPYEVSSKVKLLVKSSANNSYPSGHTSKCYSMAYVAGLLFPNNKTDFFEVAKEISFRRVITGEHFPSDLKAGRKLSTLVVGGLMQNFEFKKDLKAAKREINSHNKGVKS